MPDPSAHIVAHLLGRPSAIEMRKPLSTPIHEMLSLLFVQVGVPLKKVVFCHRALPLESSTMRVPLAADTHRPLRDYGFGRGAGPDHLHVVLELGHDPRQPPTQFLYDANEWMRDIP